MTPPIEMLGTYLHLARAAELRRQPLVRDRVLVLAAVIAAQIDLAPIAAALAEEEFQTLVVQLAGRYGPEQAERLLMQLGVERGCERAAYASDGEYAAGLLGLDWDQLQREGDE
jgi:hypothetical protein